MYMSLNNGRKLGVPRENPHSHKDNIYNPHKKDIDLELNPQLMWIVGKFVPFLKMKMKNAIIILTKERKDTHFKSVFLLRQWTWVWEIIVLGAFYHLFLTPDILAVFLQIGIWH